MKLAPLYELLIQWYEVSFTEWDHLKSMLLAEASMRKKARVHVENYTSRKN